MPEKSAMDSIKVTFTLHQEVAQYGDKLLQRLNEFRKKNMFYDITLRTTDCDLVAHKVVLAACGGMFRSHFIDPKTKKILGEVDELKFACHSLGLRCILNFAYSGVLEITERNLLPTLLAANITDMKEVQEICVEKVLTRLGWLLKFNGSEDALPALTSDGKAPQGDEEAAPITIDHAFALLHELLQLNAVSFAAESRIHSENPILSDSTLEHFPCMDEVESRWPELRGVYVAVMKCVAYVKKIRLKKEGNAKEAAEECEPPKNNSSAAESAPSSPGSASVPDDQKSDDVTCRQEKTTSAEDVRAVEESKPAHGSGEALNSPHEHSLPPNVNAPVKASSLENLSRPITKPRKSIKAHHAKTASVGKVDMTQVYASTPPKAAQPSSKPQKPNSAPPPPGASHAPRKKHAAPKPPGPPPASVARTSSLSKSKSATSSGENKQPPPRPKPPSVRKEFNAKEDAPAVDYDDSMNPFADDDDDDIPTTSGGNAEYNEELNPFG